MNKHLANFFSVYSKQSEDHKRILQNIRKKHPNVPEIYFSKHYWKNMDHICDFESHLPANFKGSKRGADLGGLFVCSSSVYLVVDAYNQFAEKYGFNTDVNKINRIWDTVTHFKKHGFHELHIDRDRAKLLAQTKCNFDVNDFKCPYQTMVVVYPEDLEQDFIDEHTATCPIFSFCYHDPEEGFLEVNHIYLEKTPKGYGSFSDNYFSFGCKMPDYNLNVEESLQNIKRLRDSDGFNNHAYYYARIAINALMVSTMKDWSAPLGKKYEDEGRKHRQKVKDILPRHGAGLSFTADKVTMKLPTLTMPSGSGMTGTGSRQRWHTREAHWRRVHLGPDKRVEWRWIDSYEVNRDLKPLDAIISTHHRLNHDVKGV